MKISGKLIVVILLLFVISTGTTLILTYVQTVKSIEKRLQNATSLYWSLPAKDTFFAYTVKGKVIATEPSLKIEKDGVALTLAAAPHLEVTQIKSFTAEDALTWKTVSLKDVRIGDKVSINFYRHPVTNEAIPASIFLIRK